MKPLPKWTLRITLTAATIAALLAANRLGTTAEPAATPKLPAQSSDPEAILATKPATGSIPSGYKPSDTLTEIVKLAQSGVSEEVLLAYINNSGKAFAPTPEDIIFLNDLGVSEAVIKALINSKGGAATPAAPAPAKSTAAPGPTAAPAVYATTPPEINGVVATPAPGVVAPPAPATTVVITQPAQVETVSYFYDSLAPYGSWVNIGGYGWCWQPTVAVVNVGWRAYCDNGRWIYSNHGWYWNSDYSWGWAPFHYGRWHQHGRIGWVWVPDTVWGPSWVSWRYSSSYCGWAPLPPAARYRPGFGFSYFDGRAGIGFEFGLGYSHYNFLPVSRFCDRTPRHHLVRHTDNRDIYNNTTVINNYIVGNNNTIINQGISRDNIVRVSHTPLQEVTIRDGGGRNGPGRGSNSERITRENGRDTIYRPTLARASTDRVIEDLRRAQTGPVAPPAPKTTVKVTPPSAAPKATDPTRPKSPETVATPASPTTYGRTNGRVDDIRKARATPAPAPTPAPVATPAPPVAKVQPATSPAPVPKPQSTPAITDKRMDRERVNQLAEEARRARERGAQPPATYNAPAAKAPAAAEPPRYQNTPATQNRAPQAPQVRNEPVRAPVPAQQYRTEQGRPSAPGQQYRGEAPRQTPPQAKPAQAQPSKSASPERSSRGDSSRNESGRGNNGRDKDK